VFIKDMAYYLIPPTANPPRGTNPTVLSEAELAPYKWTFLIRSPLDAIPSYYRCTVPPLSDVTGFDHFLPSEAGYRELRLLLEYVVSKGWEKDIFLLDAEDLLSAPQHAIRRFCEHVDVEFDEGMLSWEQKEVQEFEKWKGFHEDAMQSSGLKGRPKKEKPSLEMRVRDWAEKYGEKAAQVIKSTAETCMEDYEFLRGFRQRFDAPLS
jgi:hypothetical protein